MKNYKTLGIKALSLMLFPCFACSFTSCGDDEPEQVPATIIDNSTAVSEVKLSINGEESISNTVQKSQTMHVGEILEITIAPAQTGADIEAIITCDGKKEDHIRQFPYIFKKVMDKKGSFKFNVKLDNISENRVSDTTINIIVIE